MPPSKNNGISKIKIPPKACKNQCLATGRQCFLHHHRQAQPALPYLSQISSYCRQHNDVSLNTQRCSLTKSWSLWGRRGGFEAWPLRSHIPLVWDSQGATAHGHHIPQWLPNPGQCTMKNHISVFTSAVPYAKAILPSAPTQPTPSDPISPRTYASSSLWRLSQDVLFIHLLQHALYSIIISLLFLTGYKLLMKTMFYLCMLWVYKKHGNTTDHSLLNDYMTQWLHDRIRYYQYRRKIHQNLSYNF